MLAKFLLTGDSVFRMSQDRALPPSALLQRLRPVERDLGITRVGDLTGLDRIGVHVFKAVRPMARSASLSFGCSLDPEDAKVAAIMEAVERHGAEETRLTRHPGRASDFEHSFDFREFGAEAEGLSKEVLDWAEGADMSNGRPYFAPMDLVHLDLTLRPQDPRLVPNFIGLASGTTLAEAAAFAIYELIEAHATLEFKALPQSKRDSLLVARENLPASGMFSIAMDRIEDAGLRLLVWNLTNHLQVPVFRAMIMEDPNGAPGGGGFGTSVGTAAHSDWQRALSRAVCEAIQTRMTAAYSGVDRVGARHAEILTASPQFAEGLAHFVPKHAGLADMERPDLGGASAVTNLSLLTEKLYSAGLGPVGLFDLTHPDIGLPVVRTISARMPVQPPQGILMS